MSEQFQISPETALTVVLTTIGVYLGFVVLVRLVGPRSLTSISSFDFAGVVAFGSVIGRTILLEDPTLMIALVGLATLFTLQGVLGLLRQNPRLDRWLNGAPVLLALDGRLLEANMSSAHVVESEIRQALRRAGVHGLAEVKCVVLERNGAISVVTTRHEVDPWLLEDLRAGSG